MKLYLVRHGESISSAPSDDERTLNEKGRAQIQELANFISPLKIRVSHIWQSPKLRAQETASILASAIQSSHGIDTRIELDPLASVDDIIDEMDALNDDILLVGHMPFMGKLAAKLITGNEHQDVVSFKTGSMVCLEKMNNIQWVLCWMLNPELFI